MSRNILIVFGKPGAGKSYVAQILADSFGYICYNGDDAIPSDIRKMLFKKGKITDDMRSRFLDNMIAEIKKLSQEQGKLVVHQTFLKEYMRKKVLIELPTTTFILVECADEIREKRYLARIYFNLGLGYLRSMTKLFEATHIPHLVIYNNMEGTQSIIKQLQKIFKA